MNAIKHWRWQRYSALALFFLLPWVIYDFTMLHHTGGFNSENIRVWLSEPLRGIAVVVTFAIALYHAKLGVEVICEDYIPNPNKRKTVILLSQFTILLFWSLLAFAIISNLSIF